MAYSCPFKRRIPLLKARATSIQEGVRQEEYRQNLTLDASVLDKQAQEQERRRQILLFEASVLEEQEQEQRVRQQKLISDASVLEKGEQEQRTKCEKLIQDEVPLREQRGNQEQQWQKLISDANAIKEQERKQEEQQQKLTFDAKLLEEQEQRQAHQQQMLILGGNTLKEQKLAQTANIVREQQRMNKSRLSPSTQMDIPELAAAGHALRIEAGENLEHEDHLQRTRNQISQAQRNQPQRSQTQQEQAQENRAAKRRQADEVGDASVAYQKGRKLMGNNKYQRLNSYKWLRRDINLNNTLPADNINQEDTTPIPRKNPRSPLHQQQRRQQQQQQWGQEQQRRDTQQQKRAIDGIEIPPIKNALIGFTSDFTFEFPKTPSGAP